MCIENGKPTTLVPGLEFSESDERLMAGSGIRQTGAGFTVSPEFQLGDDPKLRGPFDKILIYEPGLTEGFIGDVPVDEGPNNIRSLEDAEYKQQNQALDNITRLENSPTAKADMISYRRAYIVNFVFGFLPTLRDTLNSSGGEEMTVLSPQRGGEPIIEMIRALHKLGEFDNVEALKFEAKRMFLKDGRCVVGISGLKPEDIGANVAVIDDCLASMASAKAIADCALKAREGKELILGLSFGFGYVKALNGLYENLTTQTSENDKHAIQKPRVARKVHGINKARYLTVAKHEKEKFPDCDQVVGDMGDAMDLSGKDGELLRLLIHRVVSGDMSFAEVNSMAENLLQ
jgi:hypothetical protein